MPAVKSITGREILDSRGNPAVEVDVKLKDGSFGRAAVPSGASTGSHEAHELRDGGERYGGKGVMKAIANVQGEIQNEILNKTFTQETLDRALIALDGTETKERLGANAILGVSLAFAHAMAVHEHTPLFQYFAKLAGTEDSIKLPVPMMNILNGGAHAKDSTDVQEFMVVPHGAPTFAEALRYGTETFHALKKILTERNLATTVGDEGGFAPELSSNEAALELVCEAIEKAGYKACTDISIAIDSAATEFCQGGKYILKKEHLSLTSGELIELYKKWADRYPIVSIEDGLAEDDWEGFSALTKALGEKIQIVGDDIFVTNKKRLQKGIELKAANAILIKLNQVGTVTETIETVNAATAAGFSSVVSHRSGETEDTSIADLAVGLGTGQIKTGAPSRAERTAKYNRLLRIEEELGTRARFAGESILKHG